MSDGIDSGAKTTYCPQCATLMLRLAGGAQGVGDRLPRQQEITGPRRADREAICGRRCSSHRAAVRSCCLYDASGRRAGFLVVHFSQEAGNLCEEGPLRRGVEGVRATPRLGIRTKPDYRLLGGSNCTRRPESRPRMRARSSRVLVERGVRPSTAAPARAVRPRISGAAARLVARMGLWTPTAFTSPAGPAGVSAAQALGMAPDRPRPAGRPVATDRATTPTFGRVNGVGHWARCVEELS
jgi:hypothetical protein